VARWRDGGEQAIHQRGVDGADFAVEACEIERLPDERAEQRNDREREGSKGQYVEYTQDGEPYGDQGQKQAQGRCAPLAEVDAMRAEDAEKIAEEKRGRRVLRARVILALNGFLLGICKLWRLIILHAHIS